MWKFSKHYYGVLQAHQSVMAQQHLRDLFQTDPQRCEKFSLLFNDILVDFSKQPINHETIDRLLALAHQQKRHNWITRMFSGEKINSTEQRAALHIALRSEYATYVDGVNVMPEVSRVLKQMERFSVAVQSGARKGYTGKIFTDIVNIGIGGSDLGPVMVTEALKPYGLPAITPHFVSNIDGAQLFETLQHLDPATTLFIIASLGAKKIFHVSPFLEVKGSYRFRFHDGEHRVGVWIDYLGEDGEAVLHTSLVGTRRTLSARSLLRCFFRYPLVTFKVIGMIHVHALRMVAKGFTYHRKPPLTAPEVSR